MKSTLDPRKAAIGWYADRTIELEAAALRMRAGGWHEEWVQPYDEAAVLLDRAAEAEDLDPPPEFIP